MDQLVCSRVPLPQYIKDQRGEAGRPRRARQESPTPSGSRIPPPPNPSWNRIRGGGGKRERGRPPLLVLFGPRRGGERGPSLATSPLFH